jgi:RsiW-degrading membrane proteinase PrsW (M82 family)
LVAFRLAYIHANLLRGSVDSEVTGLAAGAGFRATEKMCN